MEVEDLNHALLYADAPETRVVAELHRRLSCGPGGRCRGTTPLPHFRPRALPLTAPHPSKSLRNIEQVSYNAAPANKDTAEADLPQYTLKTSSSTTRARQASPGTSDNQQGILPTGYSISVSTSRPQTGDERARED